jgi:hypothetical protein
MVWLNALLYLVEEVKPNPTARENAASDIKGERNEIQVDEDRIDNGARYCGYAACAGTVGSPPDCR